MKCGYVFRFVQEKIFSCLKKYCIANFMLYVILVCPSECLTFALGREINIFLITGCLDRNDVGAGAIQTQKYRAKDR